MSYNLCDMDCDQEINKPELVEHCSDCLCTGGLGNLDQQDVPATKAWRPTSVVEERIRIKTLSHPGISTTPQDNQQVVSDSPPVHLAQVSCINLILIKRKLFISNIFTFQGVAIALGQDWTDSPLGLQVS